MENNIKDFKMQVCKEFNCTMSQLNEQYKANALTFASMRDKAAKTNKKINGYSFSQLVELTAKYQLLSEA